MESTQVPVQQEFVNEAKRFLASAGYEDANLVSGYGFAKPQGTERLERATADLVAFSTTPHSIRTAAVGVVDATSGSSSEKLSNLRYLGTPVALVGGAERVE